MKISEVHWKQTIPIRHQVLCPQEAPEFCHVEGDEQALHFGVYLDTELVSVASIYLDDETARLRKFATLNTHQGKGISSKLLKHILGDLKSKDGFPCLIKIIFIIYYFV